MDCFVNKVRNHTWLKELTREGYRTDRYLTNLRSLRSSVGNRVSGMIQQTVGTSSHMSGNSIRNNNVERSQRTIG